MHAIKVGIDATSLYQGLSSGVPYQTYNLVKALQEINKNFRAKLLYRSIRPGRGRALLQELRNERTEVRRGILASPQIQEIWNWGKSLACPNQFIGKVDVFHSLDGIRPNNPEVPTVVTISDLTTFLFPETHNLINRLVHQRKLSWASQYADRVIAISEATKQDIIEIGDIPASRIDVVPLGCGVPRELITDLSTEQAQRVAIRYGLEPNRYILSVGTIEPRKNQLELLRAFQSIQERFPEYTLVFAGKPGWKTRAIEQEFRAAEQQGQVQILGFVPDQDLAALYRGAAVMAYPSLYEGFGHPIVEAMVAGTPVLTSNVSSMPEVAGDAAVLVDPHERKSIQQGLEKLLSSSELRKQLSQKGKKRARQFSWEQTARKTLDTYRQAIREFHE